MDRRILLGAAFVFCAVGVYGLLNSSKTQELEVVKEAPPAPTMTEVWVAQQPLKKGDVINSVHLKAKMVLEKEAQIAGVMAEKRYEILEGAIAGKDFAKDEIIAENQIVVPGHPQYLTLLMGPDQVPYPISFDGDDAMLTMISPGEYVDVMLIASVDENLANNRSLNSFDGLSVTPLLKKRQVLEIRRDDSNSTVVISLNKKDISRMMIARRIGLLDVYKSGRSSITEAHVSDVLKNYTSVTELRGNQSRGAERVAF